MVYFYFAISIIMIVIAFNTWFDCYAVNICILSVYIFSKVGLETTMLVFIQRDYSGNWDDNVCDSLKPLTLFWLIWNYCITSVSFIVGCIYFICPLCDC